MLPAASESFDLRLRPRVVFGSGCLSRLGELAKELGAKRALLVTDEGLVQAGHVQRAEEIVRDAGLECIRFATVHENPSTSDVESCRDAAAVEGIDLFIGFGGGSSIDTAKGANFLLTNGGVLEDYWGFGKAVKPMLPLIAVPTTAGTGSEVQSFALIAQEKTHRKMACGDAKAAPAIALLDPDLTLSMPQRVTSTTGLDTITHAVECVVTKAGNPMSRIFARESFRRANPAFERILSEPTDRHARGEMMLASALAGWAIECSMLGAAHALANPLTAQFGIVHGQAVATMLPHVVRYNAADETAARHYLELAHSAGLWDAQMPTEDGLEALALRLEHLLVLSGLPRSLEESEVRSSDLGDLATDAAKQWTAGFNPREVGVEELRSLYAKALRV